MKFTRAWVLLTDACNLSCTYCFQKNKGKSESSKELLEKSIQFLLSNSEEDVEIMLWGGEPLLRFDLIEFAIEKFPSLNFKFATNGTLIDQKVYDYILKHRDNICVCLSIDGLEQRENRGCDVPELAYKVASIKSNFVHIVSVDPTKIYDSVKFIYDKGVRNFQISLAHGVSYDASKIEQYKEQIKKLLVWFRQDFFKLKENRLNILNWEDTLRNHLFPQKKYLNFCGAGYSAIAIAPNGDIYPCDWFYDLKMNKLGDIFSGINESERVIFNEINKDRKKYYGKHCNGCPIDDICGSHLCLTENIVVNKDMFKPVSTTCVTTIMEKQLIIEEGIKEPKLIREDWKYATR